MICRLIVCPTSKEIPPWVLHFPIKPQVERVRFSYHTDTTITLLSVWGQRPFTSLHFLNQEFEIARLSTVQKKSVSTSLYPSITVHSDYFMFCVVKGQGRDEGRDGRPSTDQPWADTADVVPTVHRGIPGSGHPQLHHQLEGRAGLQCPPPPLQVTPVKVS